MRGRLRPPLFFGSSPDFGEYPTAVNAALKTPVAEGDPPLAAYLFCTTGDLGFMDFLTESMVAA